MHDHRGRKRPLDLIVRPSVYERYRDAAVHAKLIVVRGRVERHEGVVHLFSVAFEGIEQFSEKLSGYHATSVHIKVESPIHA